MSLEENLALQQVVSKHAVIKAPITDKVGHFSQFHAHIIRWPTKMKNLWAITEKSNPDSTKTEVYILSTSSTYIRDVRR